MEVKHAEYLRMMETFRFLSSRWHSAGNQAINDGFRAFAMRQLAVYDTLLQRAIVEFCKAAEPRLLGGKDAQERTAIIESLTFSGLVEKTLEFR